MLQFVREFAKLGLTRSVGGVLGLALARELTPVVTSIILAGGGPVASPTPLADCMHAPQLCLRLPCQGGTGITASGSVPQLSFQWFYRQFAERVELCQVAHRVIQLSASKGWFCIVGTCALSQ